MTNSLPAAPRELGGDFVNPKTIMNATTERPVDRSEATPYAVRPERYYEIEGKHYEWRWVGSLCGLYEIEEPLKDLWITEHKSLTCYTGVVS